MNMLSTLINGINMSEIAGQKLGFNSTIDFNDSSFENLLKKQMSVQEPDSVSNQFESIGIPAGFKIQELNIDNIINQDKTNKILNQAESNLTDIMDFAKKKAANFYGKYSGSVITDLAEFVEDALKL